MTVPPSRCASRTAGGKDGGGPSRRRRAIAGRENEVWREKNCAAPHVSHAQRSSRRSRDGRHGGASVGFDAASTSRV
jgi:hypothetical protein